MLASIDLNDKISFPVCKICKIRTYRELSHKLESIEPSAA